MNREDLRVVQFTVIEKTKAKKGKKTQKKEKKKYGYFHLWGTNVNGKGNEKFFGLVEEAVSGSLLEVSYKDIRFLSEAETEEYFEEAEADSEETTEEVLALEQNATPESTDTPQVADEAVLQAETEAPAKRAATRRARS
jgi:hypothetical protein